MEGGSKILPFKPRDWPHEKAMTEANRRDTVWFRNHPARLWRARPSIPNEFKTGEFEDHNIALVHLNFLEGCFERIPLIGNAGIPDSDDFLGVLWGYIRIKKRPGERLDIPADAHLTILQLTGHGVSA